MSELIIEIPEGYEIDKELSTFSKIVFKKSIPFMTSKKSSFNIGDVVRVTDGSANFDKNTNKSRWGIDRLFVNNSAKVIENNLCIFHDDLGWNEPRHRTLSWRYCDLLLEFPRGEQVYCASEHCRLVGARVVGHMYEITPKSF